MNDNLDSSNVYVCQPNASGTNNEESADTIPPMHVPISRSQKHGQEHKHGQERKLRKKYKRLKQDSSQQIFKYQNENDVLKTQIEEMQRYLQSHEKKLRKSDKRKGHNYSKLANQYSDEMNALKE